MVDEPSILDYLKSKIFPHRYAPVIIPEEGEVIVAEVEEAVQPKMGPVDPVRKKSKWTWRAIPWKPAGALLMALVAQILLEPPRREAMPALFFYGWAAMLIVVAAFKDGLQLAGSEMWKSTGLHRNCGGRFFDRPAVHAGCFPVVWGNRFTVLNMTLWAVMLFFMLHALWEKEEKRNRSIAKRISGLLQEYSRTVTI